MGSFYTQVLVTTPDAEACAHAMKSLRRSAMVVPSDKGISVVCDRESEEQDIRVLDSVAMTLSAHLNTCTVGLLNHDDDVFILRYFNREQALGGLHVGHTPLSLRGSVARLRQLLRPSASLISLYAAFLRPYLFQYARHRRIAQVLDLPMRSVGYGYRYISEPKLRDGFDMSGVIQV